MLSLLKQSRLCPFTVQCRQISYNTLSNKKITRLDSDIELGDCEFNGRLINRNPRNLEQLSFESKPTGFWLDKAPASDWYTVIFEENGRHLNAYLKHWSGKRFIEASTREPQLRKYFKSTNTIQAAKILGQVISRRCLQSGYLCAGTDRANENSKGIKTQAFFGSLASNGFLLSELPEIVPRSITDL